MSAPDITRPTRVLLSFSDAYADLARRIGNDLRAANIEVRFDAWEGGGGVPAIQSLAGGVDAVRFVLPLLTPSDSAPTWIGSEWKAAIHDEARARGVELLPLRGDGDMNAVPDFLRDRSFADLRGREYSFELRRLVETIRDLSGDAAIRLPDAVRAVDTNHVPPNPLTLEVGHELAPLLAGDESTRPFVDEMVPMLVDGLFYELGVQFPQLQLQRASDLAATSARIVINGIAENEVRVRPGCVMVNDSVGALAALGIAAEEVVNPVTGAACAWIRADQAEASVERGATTWDPRDFLILALSATLRRKAAHFIGTDTAQAMLAQIEPVFPLLVAETVPKTVSLFVLTDVLRRLVAERVSIRNLRRILMALADWGRVEHDPLMLTEYVRAALQRQITHQMSRGTNRLVVFLLDPAIETMIRDAMRHTATGSYVELEPARLKQIVNTIGETMATLPNGVQVPQILTLMEIRSCVRRLVATSMPWLHVVSYQELRPDTNIQPVGRISLDGPNPINRRY